MTETLLPANASPQEVALDLATARIAAPPAERIGTIWNPETCPAPLLPWLAWALSVDEWDGNWPEERQRAVIAASVQVHRRKGTVASVKEALVAAGWGDATLVERYDDRYDGTVPRDGTRARAGSNHWATYRLILSRPITLAQADAVRRWLSVIAPARCHLAEIVYTQANHIYNAQVPRNGTYSRGVA